MMGAGMAVSEMVASNSLLWGSEKTIRRGNHEGEVEPKVIQIAGSDPAMMAEAGVLRRLRSPHRLEAKVEVEGAGHRFEGGGEERWPTTAAPLCLALAQHQRLAEIETAGQPGEPGRQRVDSPRRRRSARNGVGAAPARACGAGSSRASRWSAHSRRTHTPGSC